jgi:arabinogalactan oligomer/maltooligosaccharide transport system permease protein
VDISRPLREFLPRGGGLLLSLLLLLLALLVAAAGGAVTVLVARAFAPDAPVWLGLLGGLATLIPTLRAIARRFDWILPWYYLLPALVFLLTFTFFPVVLTVILAFTDYAGIRNGQLNVASETEVVAIGPERRTLEIADPRVFDCEDLRNGCAGARALLYGSGDVRVEAVELDGVRLRLTAPPPEGREVRGVDLFLPDLGFAFESAVAEVDGATLVLEREPPFPPDLGEVTLRLERPTLQITMTGDEGATLRLSEPVPEGFEIVSVARYNDFGFVGLRNFQVIFAQATRALGPVFLWNVGFATLTVILNLAVGTLLAVLLNNPDLRFRGLYRTLLIIPWALPNIITIQVWRGFLNQNFGAINRLLMLLDVTPEPVNWLLGSEWPARGAVLLVNLWLGYPFMMVAVLGALSAIPRELYEAARIDGASAWRSFTDVTAPLLRTALVPITLTGFAFNFNNFNIIYLLTDGGPAVDWGTATARGTDILISWAYNEAFRSQGGYAYGLGSAISILIFAITLAVSLVNFRVTGALREVRNT